LTCVNRDRRPGNPVPTAAGSEALHSRNLKGLAMTAATHDRHSGRHYVLLLVMAVLHFIAMYLLMYAMVDRLENVYPNNNQLYMAVLMTAPMLLFELVLMRSMYPNARLNALVVAGGFVLLIGAFLLIRQQTAIGDTQFLRSMIPHHAGAILMCEEASLEDAQIRELCVGIIESQQAEIDWMAARLRGEAGPPPSAR
jgi:hypothetical protein